MAPERPAFAPLFLDGVERFNERRYWDAHESWERLWLCASSPLKEFLQGLIQLAAAYHHLQRGTIPGGLRLMDSALRKLALFEPGYCGVDREAIVRAGNADRETAASGGGGFAFPRIPNPDQSSFPRDEEW